VSSHSQTSVEKARRQAYQRWFARWIHVVRHCFRLKEGHSYRETPKAGVHDRDTCCSRTRLGRSARLQHDLQVVRSVQDMGVAGVAARFSVATPAVRTRRSRQHVLRPPSCVVVLSSASRSAVQALKVTTLTDVKSLAVLDVQITAR